jgi:hypothetical protein
MPRKRKNKQDKSMSIFFILDGSGSMHPVQHDVVSGVNGFVDEQKKDGDNTVFSLTVFDSAGYGHSGARITRVFDAVPVKDVRPVTQSDTLQGGGTPLLDAIGKTLVDVDNKNLPGKKLVIIYTDGMENTSREYKNADVKALIERLTGKGDWTFVFMSADIDQFGQATQIGIPLGNVITTDSSRTHDTMTAVSKAAMYYRSAPAAASMNYVEDYGLDKVAKKKEPTATSGTTTSK